ncbi:MAG: CapA family protein [Nitrososphaerales archaeon]
MSIDSIKIFMCGDVMTGRGIDQILPYPSNPIIHEPFVKDAKEYVRLGEMANGYISKPVEFSYIWGDALKELEKEKPDLRIINLETAITKSDDYFDKGINYRMNPDNIPCLKVANIDFCSLANNHTLDWGYSGLIETLDTLKKANIKSAGAGMNIDEAESPAIFNIKNRKVIIFSYGLEDSGIPLTWAAKKDRAGLNLLKDLSRENLIHIKEKVREFKEKGDIAIASIHWGSNWGYMIPNEHIEFAHKLIDDANFDVIHGHSSHHVKGIEVYNKKLIIYGCGDFINDYEGITGYEEYRSDLGLMYFLSLDENCNLISLHMIPTQIKKFRVNKALRKDASWLKDVLNRECKRFGISVHLNDNLILKMPKASF